MLKRIVFLLSLLSINVCAIDNNDQEGISTRTVVTCTVVIVACGAIAAPFILPAATLATIQAAGVAAAAQVAAASTAVSTGVGTAVTAVAGPTIGTAVGSAAGAIVTIPNGIGIGISGVKTIRPYLIQTQEEEFFVLIKLEKKNVAELKTNLSQCLIKNKNDVKNNDLNYPTQCQETAYKFGLLAGQHELNQVRKNIE